jgi:hypothetical protein
MPSSRHHAIRSEHTLRTEDMLATLQANNNNLLSA